MHCLKCLIVLVAGLTRLLPFVGLCVLLVLMGDFYFAAPPVDAIHISGAHSPESIDPYRPDNPACKGDPIDVSLGAYLNQKTVLSVNGAISLTLTLSYNSFNPQLTTAGLWLEP